MNGRRDADLGNNSYQQLPFLLLEETKEQPQIQPGDISHTKCCVNTKGDKETVHLDKY